MRTAIHKPGLRSLRSTSNATSRNITQRKIRGVQIKAFGIEVTTNPCQRSIMVLMVWISYCLEELGIAVDTANILRWAGVRAIGAVNQGRRDVRMQEPILDDYDVVPVVA
jgi:hypothetical protein